MEGHERPILDIGSKVVMKPGMVFTAEPEVTYLPILVDSDIPIQLLSLKMVAR